jgi:hypothetical protein
MTKITYIDAINLLQSCIAEGLQRISLNKYNDAEKLFIKAVKITRQLNKIKRLENRNDIVKKLTLENQNLKKKLKNVEDEKDI